MKESEARLKEAQQIAKIGYWELNHIDNSVSQSDEVYRMLGVEPDEFKATYEGGIDYVHPEDREMVAEALANAVRKKIPYNITHRMLPADGAVKYVHSRSITDYDEDGEPVRSLGTLQDITEKRLIEIELEKHREHLEKMVQERTEELSLAKEAAEAANKAKTTFLATMSHELRTPLNAVLGFSQMMERDASLFPGHLEKLKIINRSGKHLLNLINDVLDMSKIEAGHIEIRKRSFDLKKLLKNIEETARLQASQKQLTFSLVIEPDVPRFIAADKRKLNQILVNLLGNALKFTEKGGVMVRVRKHPAEPGPLQPQYSFPLCFQIEDTGPGVLPEEVERLFETFVRGGSGNREGTGLGLAISRKFARLMGGDIRAENRAEGGAVFFLHILAEAADQMTISDRRRPARRIIGIEPGQPEYRILTVEDQAENRLLLNMLLKSAGFRVREAVNGLDGVRQAEKWRPHLIWMDMQMPVMNGYKAARIIRNSAHGATVKIIALTAGAFEDDRKNVLNAGCDDFIHKPFHGDDIFEVMSRQLNIRYLYEDACEADSVIQPPRSALVRPGDLKALPPAWRDDFYKASISGQGDICLKLIEEIRPVHPRLGENLIKLVREFRFDLLIKLV